MKLWLHKFRHHLLAFRSHRMYNTNSNNQISERKVVFAKIPISLEFPDEMAGAIIEVLEGEYESGFSGDNLTILDIGANVGSFALWANIRWSSSQIHCYEPHPETFKILTRNVKNLSNIKCHNFAVYPSNRRKETFYTRYAGDGESGLVDYVNQMFESLPSGKTFEVNILHPDKLPNADIIKIDTEGAEFQILSQLDLTKVSLILLEYHFYEDKERIKDLLQNNFIVKREDDFAWDDLLHHSEYKQQLKGDYYGRLFFVNKANSKLHIE